MLGKNLYETINQDLLNYYLTPGNIYNLVNFGKNYDIDLVNLNLKNLLKLIISNNFFKKDSSIKYLIYELIEFYFTKINFSLSTDLNEKYSHFLKRITDTKKFNLDEESLFMEFEDKILNA